MQMNTTGLVVFIAFIILALYDLWCVVRKGTASSISNFLITTVFKSPIISFVFGCIAGHLFFYMWAERPADIAQFSKLRPKEIILMCKELGYVPSP